ncbi:hypothetical protein BDD12DRAFT_893447 [Trichophaea hybrida]|nr:hypothetical protein BDD12DRAFT_893447 [Trichophaea hybrida]
MPPTKSIRTRLHVTDNHESEETLQTSAVSSQWIATKRSLIPPEEKIRDNAGMDDNHDAKNENLNSDGCDLNPEGRNTRVRDDADNDDNCSSMITENDQNKLNYKPNDRLWAKREHPNEQNGLWREMQLGNERLLGSGTLSRNAVNLES